MKKKTSTIALIAITVITSCITLVTSCIKEDNTPPVPAEQTQSVTIKCSQLEYAEGSRAIGSQIAENEIVKVKNGMLYFVNKGTREIKNALIVIPPTADVQANNETNVRYDELISEEGVTLKNISIDADAVHFFGNIATEFTPMPGKGEDIWTKALANMITMHHQYDGINKGLDNVSLYGNNDIKDAKVSMKIDPVVARIQIPKLIKAGEITGFKLIGIFLNNFYHCTPMYGIPNNGDIVNYSTFEQNEDLQNPTYYSPYYQYVIYDWDPTNGLGTFHTTNTDDYTPGNGNSWVYNVFGGKLVPQLVFVLTDVTATPSSGLTYIGRQYVTVKGFKNADTGSTLETISNGKTYTFTDGIQITEAVLTADPISDPGSPDASVDESPWEDTTVEPIH